MMSTDNDFRKFPPSREALVHHTKRAFYQAGYLWRKLIDNFDLPDPKSLGREKVTVIMILCGNQRKWAEMNSRLSVLHVFVGRKNAKSVNVEKLQWNASLIVYVEENVAMYNLVMLRISNYFWCYFIMKLFYSGLLVWILHLKDSIWHAWDSDFVNEELMRNLSILNIYLYFWVSMSILVSGQLLGQMDHYYAI